MPDRIVLQKLLTNSLATAIVETGDDQVGGYVANASAAATLRTPAQVLSAYGIDAAPQFVDVVRFEQPLLAPLSAPPDAPRPWTTFPHGFLHGGSLAQVWTMGRTRYSYGAEYWRIRADGEQKRLSRYEGAARGWANAKQWRPPGPMVGTLARWKGGEFFADVLVDSVILTTVGEQGPKNFEQIHARAWSATVALSDAEVFERVFTAELDGVPVRILRTSGPTAEVLLLTDDPAVAERIKGGMVEPGVFEVIVDTARLTNTRGVENQLSAQSG